MSTAGTTGPAPAEGKNYRAVTAKHTDQQNSQTELEMEESHRLAEQRVTRLYGPTKKPHGTATFTPISGHEVETGIVAAVTVKQAQANGIKREMLPGGPGAASTVTAPTGSTGAPAGDGGRTGPTRETGPTGMQPGRTPVRQSRAARARRWIFWTIFLGRISATLLRSKSPAPRVSRLLSRPTISTRLTVPGSKNSSLITAPPASIFISARTRSRERFTRKPKRTTWPRHATFGSTLTRGGRAA